MYFQTFEYAFSISFILETSFFLRDNSFCELEGVAEVEEVEFEGVEDVELEGVEEVEDVEFEGVEEVEEVEDDGSDVVVLEVSAA